MKIMVTSFWRSCAYTATLSAPTLQQATADSHLPWRLLDTHREFWVSLLWGHGSILLGSGACKILSVPSKSLFPQSYVNSVIKSRSILPIYLSVPLLFFFFFSFTVLVDLTLITLNFFPGRLPISLSFILSCGFLLCSFICCMFLCLFLSFNLLCLESLFFRLEGLNSSLLWFLPPQWMGLDHCLVNFSLLAETLLSRPGIFIA